MPENGGFPRPVGDAPQPPEASVASATVGNTDSRNDQAPVEPPGSGSSASAESDQPWVYGVAHLDSDGDLDYYREAPDVESACRDAYNCQVNGDGCYLVRRPVDAWEKVPDGE